MGAQWFPHHRNASTTKAGYTNTWAMGAVFLILTSGLYYVANHDNQRQWWAHAVLNNKHWPRMESVPSTMFFVLLNLCKKNPLAFNYHDVGQRTLVVLVNLFGVPLFALPTTYFGSVIMRVTMAEHKEYQK